MEVQMSCPPVLLPLQLQWQWVRRATGKAQVRQETLWGSPLGRDAD